MPFKADADRRHHILKQRHRAKNSAAYDTGLRQRGSVPCAMTPVAAKGLASLPALLALVGQDAAALGAVILRLHVPRG